MMALALYVGCHMRLSEALHIESNMPSLKKPGVSAWKTASLLVSFLLYGAEFLCRDERHTDSI